MIYLNSSKSPEVGDEICNAAEDLDNIKVRRMCIEEIKDNGDIFVSSDGPTYQYNAFAALLLDRNLPINVGDIVLHYDFSTPHVWEVISVDRPFYTIRPLGHTTIVTTTENDIFYLSSSSKRFENENIKKDSRVTLLGSRKEYVVNRLYPWTNKSILYDFEKDRYFPSAISDLTFAGPLLMGGDRVVLKSDKSSLRKVYQVETLFNDNHTLTIYDQQHNSFLTDIKCVEKLKDSKSYIKRNCFRG